MADNSEHYSNRLEAVNAETLTPMVRELLGDSTLHVTSWKYEPVPGGFGAAAGPSLIYRFSGTCEGKSAPQTWSLILKIVLARSDEAPADPKYWKREYELYRSGLLDNLPPGVSAAQGYGVSEYLDESVWVWMEDIKGDLERPWPESQYVRVGRDLGRFNGAYLTGTPIPSEPWLSVDWIRKMTATMDTYRRVSVIKTSLAHPLVRDHFPSNAVEQLSRLWDEREVFLNALDHLPQTFAHQDSFGRNLFVRRISHDGYETIAIDWAFAGRAAIGLDAAMAIIIDVFVGDLEASRSEALDPLVFKAYAAALHEVGWDGSERQARLGYTASTALKYLELINPVEALTEEASRERIASILGKPVDYMINQFAGMHRYAHKLADEARALMQIID